MKHLDQVVESLLSNHAHTATKFVAPNQVIRATRRLSGGKIDRRENVEIVLTIGRPNHEERDFIKTCQKAGEPFPVKKIRIKGPPKRKGPN